jgi:CheY-like chemotaxis protein
MPSVLIVDDLVSIHEMLEAVIQPTGFATSFATDGEKALVRYKADKFDLVLADIDMKPMDGITLLKQLSLLARLRSARAIRRARSAVGIRL